MAKIVLVAHDMRSTHNVGSLLRTAEGLGIDKVYLTGYTPHPVMKNDTRLPYLAQKIHKQIQKTALGAESTQKWEQITDIKVVIKKLQDQGYVIAALEQASDATHLPDFHPPSKVAIILGNEVDGLSTDLLSFTSVRLEIPMFGSKESFNVVQAAAMALYHCKFIN
jgi:23S rRNA (guanosine2251-2'-O)-methyltransferase